MSKAYWVSTYHAIHNEAARAAYSELAGPALTAAGGKFIVRGIPQKAMEAGKLMRVVIIEFESLAAAQAAYESAAYQKALAVLGEDAAVRDIRIVEGL